MDAEWAIMLCFTHIKKKENARYHDCYVCGAVYERLKDLRLHR